MKETHVEPLKGEEREKRLVLDWVSEAVFLIDFIKLKMGKEGVIESGEHLGSIEKSAWKNVMDRLSSGEFLARTYRGNYEPIGFKAKIYEEHDGSAVMVVTECPYVSFWKKCMKGIGNLTEDDLCGFCHATFAWVSEFNFECERQQTSEECRIIISRRK